MPLTYDQISAITEKKFIPKLHDAIFDSNPLLQRMKKKGGVEKVDGGTSLMVPLNYAQITAGGWYAGSDTLDTTDNDIITAAEFQWKQLYVNISVKRSDELKNAGDAAKLKMVANKVKVAEKTMSDLLGTALFNSGTDAKAVAGLRQILSSSNTVGGISTSTYSWWAAQVDTSATLTIPNLQTQNTAATVDSEMPTVHICTRANYNRFYNLLQPAQRFLDTETAKGGFTSLMFNGKPVIPDSHCPANHWFQINEEHIKLYVMKDEDMRFEPFVKPVNQNVKTAKLYWMGAFGSSNNRLQVIHNAFAA